MDTIYPLFIHMGGLVSGCSFIVQGGFQIPRSPTHRPPQPPSQGHREKAPVPMNMGTGCNARGSPWQGATSVVRLYGLVWFRKGAACAYMPPSLVCQDACTDNVWGVPVALPLKISKRPGMELDKNKKHFFLFTWGPPWQPYQTLIEDKGLLCF